MTLRERLLPYVLEDGALTNRGKVVFLPVFLVLFGVAMWLMAARHFNVGVLLMTAAIVGLFVLMTVLRTIVAAVGDGVAP